MKRIIFILLLCLVTSTSGQLRQKPMHGKQINFAHPLGDPVGMWLFNEGSGGQVFDLSGNGLTLDSVNSPIWSAGKFGSAVLFDDGSSQYLERDSTIVTTWPFTIVVWFKSDSITVDQSLFCIADASTTDYFMLWLEGARAGDPVSFEAKDSVGTRAARTTTGFSANTWHQAVAICTSATDRRVYIDVGSMGSNATSNTPVGLDRTSIGRRGSTAGVIYMSGLISHAMLYNRALSASEIALLYQEPFCMFAKDDIALMAKAAEAPIGGQVIIIAGTIPILFALILMRRRNG